MINDYSYASLLKLLKCNEPRSVLRVILEDAFSLSYTEILLDGASKLDSQQKLRLEQIVTDVNNGMPVQQSIGFAMFCGHRFRVTTDTLIPRPETEELVAMVSGQRVLDVGTGSGCIAVSLALRGCEVTALDISRKALQIARDNATRNGVEVTFLEGDVLNVEKAQWADGFTSSFDAIVSNPPYICYEERDAMEDMVLKYEPHQALFVPDDDPLLFYRAIALRALEWLKPQGTLYFEINRRFGVETYNLLSDMGFDCVKLIQDQFGNDRFVVAMKKCENL